MNVWSADDQTCVTMRISAGVIVMTLRLDGRPPRDRFETVPAVEITVPFRVCSTKWIASW